MLEPYYQDGPVTLFKGDNREVMASLSDNSVDAIVTDPPYELGFMGKKWDRSGIAYDPKVWSEAFRVLKPGGHALVFGGTRTWHRVAVAVEDAGFEIRDSLAWLYGQGFPKSLDVSKAIDKMRVEDFEPIRVICRAVRQAMDADRLRSRDLVGFFGDCHPRLIDHWAARDTDSQPSLPTWEQWEALKVAIPALGSELDAEVRRLNDRKGQAGDSWHAREATGTVEAWEHRTNFAMTTRDGIARDAAREGTEAAEWEGWGTALKPAFEPIVVARKPLIGTVAENVLAHGTGALNIDACRIEAVDDQLAAKYASVQNAPPRANRVYGTDSRSRAGSAPHELGRFPTNVILDHWQIGILEGTAPGASRYFYCAKAGKDERPIVDGEGHDTVKPLAVMRYLAQLVTPPKGRVLDMFAGSGTTGEAAILEGFESILIELDEDGTHIPLILKRLRKDHQQSLFGALA